MHPTKNNTRCTKDDTYYAFIDNFTEVLKEILFFPQYITEEPHSASYVTNFGACKY